MKRPKLLILASEDWYFVSHRAHLAAAAQNAGYDVAVACRVSRHGDPITSAGHTLIPLSVPRGARAPWRDAQCVGEIANIYRRHRPDIVHHVALKCILLGTAAARISGVPAVVNALAGFGHLASAGGWKTRLGHRVLRAGLQWAHRPQQTRVIVQNEADRAALFEHRVVRPEQVALVRGAGVCIKTFRPAATPAGPPLVILAARMLWCKGVGQFVAAAQELRSRGSEARFVLVGRVDTDNPNHVPLDQLKRWHDAGVVQWWGDRDDMPHVLAAASVVCLPTYYGEGLPKVLLEAAACGKALVTTNIPGCSDICRDGESGLLIPPRDASALASAIDRLLADPLLRRRLGEAGRALAMSEFSADAIAGQTLDVYRSLLPPGCGGRRQRRFAA